MFNNSGSKIKTFAVVLFVIGLVGAAISMVVMLVNLGSDGFFIGLISSGATVLVSYIGALFLSGFGELVEETSRQRQQTQKTVELLEKLVKQSASADAPTASRSSAPGSPPKSQNQDQSRIPAWKAVEESGVDAAADTPSYGQPVEFQGPAIPVPTSDGKIICPRCGEKQANWWQKCCHCGLEFASAPTPPARPAAPANVPPQRPQLPQAGPADPAARNEWYYCPMCGTKQWAGNNVCTRCGHTRSR